MRAIVHDRLGPAGEVLALRILPEPGPPGKNEVLVGVSFAPVHRGDLLAVEGSPAFGALSTLPAGGRVPGFEGAGVIEALGPDLEPGTRMRVGDRVAFFPVDGAWRERVVVPAASLVRLPDGVTDEAASQMLINTITARLVLGTGHDSLPPGREIPEQGTGVTVIQTGAGSAVGQLLTAMLVEHGVGTIRLVRSEAGAAALAARLPGPPVIATGNGDWKDRLRREIDGRPIFTLFDGVGGNLLSEIAGFLIEGGTIVNYGSLGGDGSDIRGIPPCSLVLRGVSVGQWAKGTPEQRQADMQTALKLVRDRPELFEVAARFDASDIASAVARIDQPGRSGAVLLRF